MAAIFGVIVLALACSGSGALTLNVLGLWGDRSGLDRWGLSFAVGFGVVGWLMFWVGSLGLISASVLWPLCVVLALGNYLHRTPAPRMVKADLSPVVFLLLTLAAIVVAFDAVEALSPPADADTLAYHFELPRRFAEAGRFYFVPSALNGAIPFLTHATYAAVLGLSGADSTLALTGWSFVSGWAVGLLLFTTARRWLSVPQALALALVYQTMPAVVFGAGSGQVEARMTLFALVAVAALIADHKGQRLGSAALLGLAVGFMAATKYTGLLFMVAAGLALLACRGRWLARGAVYSIVALAAGAQWYGWIYAHTGDPVFPMLYSLFGVSDPMLWPADHNRTFVGAIAARGEIIDGIVDALIFPFLATLTPPPDIESGRTGFGPFPLLILPLALWGAWQARDRVLASSLWPLMVLVIAFYFLWVNFGGVPKVRHMLPLVVPMLLFLGVSAAKAGPATRWAWTAALTLSLLVQLAGHSLFSKAYIGHVASGEQNDIFLERVLSGYGASRVINAMPEVKRVLLYNERQLAYYIKAPTFEAHPLRQALVDTRRGAILPTRFFAQLQTQEISHVLVMLRENPEPKTIESAIADLEGRGCLVREKEIPFRRLTSRTLQTKRTGGEPLVLWRVSAATCH
jgi:hypothetical protein